MRYVTISTRTAAAALLSVTAVAIAAPALADGGHTPVAVCHNRAHNPHVIIVDDNSTQLHAHMAHRDQQQLLDLVEGVDGTRAQIEAACVSDSSSPTTSPSVTSDPTTSSSTTSTTSSSTSSTSVPSTTRPPAPTITHGTPVVRHNTKPPRRTITHGAPHVSKRPNPHATSVSSAPSPTSSVPELAYTGTQTSELALLAAALLATGALLIGASSALRRPRRRH